MTKYIFIAGGVISGVGKGITTASIGKILQSKGFKVTAIKIDPYVNLDAGTMNPIEHGEIFVTDDGIECDQDIGNYERFLNQNFTTDNYITTGRIYESVIKKERNLEYNGKCVEVVPDIPNEVILRIKKIAQKTNADFVLIEIGGTVGEYQNILFLEAARIMQIQEPKNVLFFMVSYLPIPKMIGEMKTKPTQAAVRLLNASGIQPDMIFGRSQFPIDQIRKKKLSTFCNINEEDIISSPDVDLVYEIPLNFEKENLGNKILKKFGLKERDKDLNDWKKLLKKIKNQKRKIKIGIIGKYFKTGDFVLKDSYISVIEAIKHSSLSLEVEPEIIWLSAEEYDPKEKPSDSYKARKNLEKDLKNLDGIIIPGGFGNRGVEGKIKAIQFCREEKIPFLGLCLGMQLAVIEFARNVCNLKGANSTEFLPNCAHPVIDIIKEQKKLLKDNKYGGTMRLGAYDCKLKKESKSFQFYGKEKISERHRHRYELNNKFKEILEKKGMIIAGINSEKDLVEIVELKDHPFFIATQFHPEFKSRPLIPHPLFREFIKASMIKNLSGF